MSNVASLYTQSNLSQDLWAMNLSLKKALTDPNPSERSDALAEVAANLFKAAGGLAELSATTPMFSVFASATGVLTQVGIASKSVETSLRAGQSVKINDLLSLVGNFIDVVGSAMLKPGPMLIPGIALKGIALTASGAQNYLIQFGYEDLTVDQMGTMLAASVDQSNRVWGAALQGYSWDELQAASSSISLANGGHPWWRGTSVGNYGRQLKGPQKN